MIYLDTSALVKLLVRETETTALRGWLAGLPDSPKVTSVIGRVELSRMSLRNALDPGPVAQLVAGLALIPMSEPVADLASTAGPAPLRSLDAVHLASAMSVREVLTAFCCYDHRLAGAAASEGLPVVAPGAVI